MNTEIAQPNATVGFDFIEKVKPERLDKTHICTLRVEPASYGKTLTLVAEIVDRSNSGDPVELIVDLDFNQTMDLVRRLQDCSPTAPQDWEVDPIP